jgi:hypothetical protein
MLERHQNYVWCYRGATKYVDTHGVGDGVQNRAVTGTDGRLANSPCANRCFRIRNVQRLGMNRRRDVEDAQRLVVVEPPCQRGTVALIVDNSLCQRVPDSKAASTENLTPEAARVDDRADVSNGKIVDKRGLARLDVDFHFGKARDKGERVAVPWKYVFRDAHQTRTGKSLRRITRHGMDILWQLMSVELAAELDRTPCRLAIRDAAGGIAAPKYPHVAQLVTFG